MALIGTRSYRINSKRLRQVRIDVGLTQTQLAKASGYSARLIRKAETCGHLSGGAIEDIIQTLNEYGTQIIVSDMMMDEVAICKEFMKCLFAHDRDALAYCGDLVSERFVFQFAGSSENPLAGVYHGHHGFQGFLNKFFDMLERAPGYPTHPQYFLDNRSVIVSFEDRSIINGILSPPIWINAHFEVHNGLIESLTNQYDTETGLNFLRLVQSERAKEIKTVGDRALQPSPR